MSEQPTNSFIGRTLGGRYRIIELLGRGGMAEVYKAFQSSLARDVAVKVMHSFLAGDETFSNRFVREAQAIAALRHPNIINVYDFAAEEEGLSYMVMEYVDGPTLKDTIEDLTKRGERMPLDEALSIVRSVGSALDFAHKSDMIHRDVKPANVMRDSSGRVVLTDFGIAKLLSGPQYTATGSIVGTPAYMAPEQGLGKPGDHRVDIYALGVVLYQLVTGRLPFESETPMAVVFAHVNEALPLPSTIVPGLPQGIERIITKALAKDPDERYHSAQELVDHLDNYERVANMAIPTSTMSGLEAAPAAAAVGMGEPSSTAQVQSPETVVGAAGVQPQAEKRGINVPVFAAIGVGLVIGIIALIGLFAAGFFARGSGVAAAPTATASATNTAIPTDPPTATATEDNGLALQLTAQGATLAALQATATPSATPDLTATVAACGYDYVLAVEPEDGSIVAAGGTTQVLVEVENSSDCDFPDDTQLLLDTDADVTDRDGDTVTAADIGGLAPGESETVALVLDNGNDEGEIELRFAVEGDEGDLAIGEETVLTYNVAFVATATFAPTFTATATATAVQPTAAPSTGLSDVSLTFFSCDYDGSDYACLTNVNFSGGVAPWTILVRGGGDAQMTVSEGDSRTFTLRGRRCLVALGSVTVVDSTGAEKNSNWSFDPNIYALFPPSRAEVCALGD